MQLEELPDFPIRAPLHPRRNKTSGEGFTPTQSQLGNVLRHCGTPRDCSPVEQSMDREYVANKQGWKEQAQFLTMCFFDIFKIYLKVALARHSASPLIPGQ